MVNLPISTRDSAVWRLDYDLNALYAGTYRLMAMSRERFRVLATS